VATARVNAARLLTATSGVVPTTNPILRLKQFYSGTSDCVSGCTGRYSMELYIDSQDQQGNFQATVKYSGSADDYSCTGSMTTNDSITFRCQKGSSIYDFRGTLYSDGYIDGLETFQSSYIICHDVLG
jgi:hypothetical protein